MCFSWFGLFSLGWSSPFWLWLPPECTWFLPQHISLSSRPVCPLLVFCTMMVLREPQVQSSGSVDFASCLLNSPSLLFSAVAGFRSGLCPVVACTAYCLCRAESSVAMLVSFQVRVWSGCPLASMSHWLPVEVRDPPWSPGLWPSCPFVCLISLTLPHPWCSNCSGLLIPWTYRVLSPPQGSVCLHHSTSP